MTRAHARPPHRPSFPPRQRWRDTVEFVLGAFVLVLLIRHFVFQVFLIPTGSMAPTLLGQHRDLQCPNCGLEFPAETSANPGSGSAVAVCPNCKYEFPPAEPLKPPSKFCPPWLALLLGGGNRVIVDRFMWDYPDDRLAKLFYRSGLPRTFSPPKRWDVIVFVCPIADVRCRTCGKRLSGVRIDEGAKCPVCGAMDWEILDQKTYIKRLIGLPGETIRIRHGDIYVNGTLEVRPPDVQNAQWQFVYDSADVPKRPVDGVPAAWVAEEGAAELDGPTLRLTPDAEGKASARYGRSIDDVSTYSGFDNNVPYYPVGEMKWEGEVTLDRSGMLRLAIDEDELDFVAALRFGTAAAKTSLHAFGPGADAELASVESEFSAEPGKPHRVTFSNASGRLELAVDGATVLSCEHPMPENDLTVSSGVVLGVETARAEFARVRLYRTIYYRPPYGGTFAVDTTSRPVMALDTLTSSDGYRIPAGQYLALGDNQPSSWDSRYWGMVPQRDLIGRGEVLCWPLKMLRAIY